MNNRKIDWGFAQVWNKSLDEGRTEKPLLPRQKIWASEIGGPQIDRFLKMTAVPISNPPNPRSLRKFEAGNIWEAIIGYVLSRAGIFIDRHQWIQYQYPGLLPVSGKLDFEAGGKPDYEKSISLISKDFNWLPEFISKSTLKIVERLKKEYPDGLKNIILEIKSCSSFMFEKYEAEGKADPKHKLQAFHYLKCKNMPEAHIIYINKDDARLLEIGVFNPSPLEDVYKKDIEEMTGYIDRNERPSLQKPIVFDEDWKSFLANWKVGYSNYLTMLYGFKDQKEFDEKYKPITERFNRVLGRIEEGKDMTENNLEAIKEIEALGFNFESIKKSLKKGE